MELVARGVPYDLAMNMDESASWGHLVVLREVGRPMETPVVFDWKTERWDKA